jgi:acyl dehydratase
MAGRNFPFPVIGLVHVANRIEQLRPIGAGESLDLAVRAVGLRPHSRGRQFDLLVTATVADQVVWRAVSTYLRKGPPGQAPADLTAIRPTEAGGPAEAGEPAEATERAGAGEPADAQPTAVGPAEAGVAAGGPAAARWRVERSVGRDYAAVSGDRNPIHTSRLGARLFGFARPIAHGMWTAARCLAALEGRLPEAYTVQVAFKLPILLPATVGYAAQPDAAGWRFTLRDARSDRPHLTGSVTPT